MPKISGPQHRGVQSVVFALNTIEYLANQQVAVGVTDLARAFDTTKSRMHRHLRTLVDAGYIVRDDETERYRISMRLMALGQAISNNFDLTGAARPALLALREKLGHSAVVSIPEAEGVRILYLISGKAQMEIVVKPGSVLGYHDSAQGKVALAFGDPVVRDSILAGNLPQSTPFTVTEPAKLAAELEETRRLGWATSPNEGTIGMNALAAPVFDALRNFVGTVAIVDSIQFITEKPSELQIRGVMEAAKDVSASLGYRENGSP